MLRSARSLVIASLTLIAGYLWLISPGSVPLQKEMATALKFLTVSPRAKHTATVIFVHGLGDNGPGWRHVAENFAEYPDLHHVKWVLPQAPQRPITGSGGMTMSAWFDIFQFGGINAQEDDQGILESMDSINQLITAEVDAGIPANRIVLGGFSQGGAMSLITGLTTKRRLAGLTILSGWLALRHQVKTMVSEHAKELPIFWGHSKDDPVVLFDVATMSHESLKTDLGINLVEHDAVLDGGIEFHSYEGLQHSTNAEELDVLQKFIKKAIPAA